MCIETQAIGLRLIGNTCLENNKKTFGLIILRDIIFEKLNNLLLS